MIDLFAVEMEIREAASDLPPDAGIDIRPFFGGLGGWARGHFFIFVSKKDGAFLKLAAGDQVELLDLAGLGDGKHHELGKQFLLVPPTVMSDPAALREWVERSVLYAVTLPLPKQKKRRGQNTRSS